MKLITEGLVLHLHNLKEEGRSFLTEEADGSHMKRGIVSFNLTTFPRDE